MLPQSDRSGDLLVRVSLAFGLTAVLIVLLVPLVSRVDPAEEPLGSLRTDERVTLLDREGGEVLAVSLGLAAVAAAPLLVPRGGAFKTSQRLSAAALVVGCVLALDTVGLVHVPSAVCMVAAALRRQRAPFS